MVDDAAGSDGATTARRGAPPQSKRWFRWTTRAVVVAIVVWVVSSAVLAGLGAAAARSGASRVRAIDLAVGFGDLVDGNMPAELAAASDDLDRSRALLTSPVLGPARLLPVVGRQLRSAEALVDSADRVVDSSRVALELLQHELEAGVPEGPGRIDLLDRLITALRDVDRAIDDADLGPSHALVGPLHEGRFEFADRLVEVGPVVDDVLAAAIGIRELIEGPSTYLVLAANNAEMRVGSGMYLSVGTVTIDRGRFQAGPFESVEERFLEEGVALPDELDALWGWSEPGSEWRNLGFSGRFPVNAEVASRMWEALGNDPVDGVLLLDVDGLGALLRVVGSVPVAEGSIGADAIGSYLLHDQYLGIDDAQSNATRREGLSDIAGSVLDRLGGGDVDVAELLDALKRARDGRHLLAWSGDPVHNEVWEIAEATGELGPDSLLLGVANIDGSKSDPFLDVRSRVTTRRIGGDAGHVDVTVEVTVANDTPATETPYILGPDRSPDYRGIVSLQMPGSAHDIDTDARDRVVASGPDGATRVLAVQVAVPTGEQQAVTFRFRIPASVARRVRLEAGRASRRRRGQLTTLRCRTTPLSIWTCTARDIHGGGSTYRRSRSPKSPRSTLVVVPCDGPTQYGGATDRRRTWSVPMRRLMIFLATFALALAFAVAPVSAQQYPADPGDEPSDVDNGGEGVLGEQGAGGPGGNSLPSGSTLPVTGGDVVGLALLGAAAVASGSAMVAYKRRTTN